MTLPTKIPKIRNEQDPEAGISLMLAVLILAAIIAITFSLVTIVFIELKSSSDAIKSEPSLYATVGVTEEALFQYKRYVNDRDNGDININIMKVTACSGGSATICQVGNVKLDSPPPDLKGFDDPVSLVTIHPGESKVIPLYELNKYNLQYSHLKLQRVPMGNSGTLKFTRREISNDPMVPVKNFESIPLLREGPPYDLPIPYIGNQQFELIIKNQDANSVQLSITSYNGSGRETGLPFIGKKVLKVVANYLGLTRTYTVYIPVP